MIAVLDKCNRNRKSTTVIGKTSTSVEQVEHTCTW